MGKTMQTIHIPKYVTIIFIVILTCTSCTNEQTFVVTDFVTPDYIPQKAVQETKDKIMGVEYSLLFSNKDVRMTMKPPTSEKVESFLFQKIGDGLYRVEEEGSGDVVDLELNTILGYIKSCKIIIYDRKHSNSSMVWSGTVILKRK